jgi:N-acetylglucosaminyldiphosphoundecaprenol N-acetyl-beta-D-mannosaminyltransferase
MPTKNIFGIRVDPLTVAQLDSELANMIKTKAHALVFHVNVFALNLAIEDSCLRSIYNRANIVFCDGAGVAIAGRWLGIPIPKRITYADWMWKLSSFCSQSGFSLYFLGARPGIAEKAARQLINRYPELKVAGYKNGYFDKSFNSIENEEVIQSINQVKPDILVVGFGMPLQEQWLAENWDRIDAHVALTGGAVFDYISGDLQRAPRWMTDHGLEWLGRLFIEPRRLWRRYLIGNPLFFWRVLKQRLGLVHFE